MQFTEGKRHKQHLQSISEGCALATDEDLLKLERHTMATKKRMTEYLRERNRQREKLVNPQYPNFAGSGVFLYEVDSQELTRMCRSQGMVFEEDHLKATVIVVADMRNKPDSLVFSAMLGGKFICEPRFLITKGAEGMSIKYHAAAAVPRKSHFTLKFAEEHEELSCAIYWYSCGKEFVPAGSPAPGKWKLIPNTDEFLAHAIKAKDKKKPSDVILFCSDLDADGAAFSDCVKLRFSKSTALESLSDVDRRWSSTGWQPR